MSDAAFTGGLPDRRLSTLVSREPGGDLAPPARPGRTIVLTSGTTGRPKGARRPTPTGFGPLCSIIDRIPLRAGARVVIAAPLFHTWGFAALQIALALRATVVLHRRFDPAAVLAAMVRERCTALIAVPVMLHQLMEADPALPVTVDLHAKTVSYGDVVVPFEIDDYVRWRLLEGWDDISLTLRHAERIDEFETTRPRFLPTTTAR